MSLRYEPEVPLLIVVGVILAAIAAWSVIIHH